MALQYYTAMAIVSQTPSEDFKSDYQQFVNFDFEASSSYYVIEEELNQGTQVYANVGVRINHIVNGDTGNKLGDDFKKIVFEDFEHVRGLGYRYRFDNNIWITVNTDFYKSVTASTVVRRCNNAFRWLDSTNTLRTEPCIIDYSPTSQEAYFSETMVLPDGTIKIIMQSNVYSDTLKLNDRVIFNGQAFKIQYKNSYLGNKTFDTTSTPLLYFTLYKDNIAPDDDLVNMIANTNKNNLYLSINQVNFTNVVGFTQQLTATLMINGVVSTDAVTWSSDNPSKVSVSSTGLATLNAVGSANITASYGGVSSSIEITVSSGVINEVRITPQTTSILQGKSQTYNVKRFLNNVAQADAFLVQGSGANSANYTIAMIDGNNFTVTNKLKSTNKLTVTCTSLVDSSVGNIVITLGGLF